MYTNMYVVRKLSPVLSRRVVRGKRVPHTLLEQWKRASGDPLHRMDTRGNGFCGWYMLALWSQLSQYPMIHAQQVQEFLSARLGFSSSNIFHRHMPVQAAAYFADLIGYNLVVWTRRVVRTRTQADANTPHWRVEVVSYQPRRMWLMAYHNTHQTLHWEILAKHTRPSPNSFRILYLTYPTQVIFRLLDSPPLTPINPQKELLLMLKFEPIQHHYMRPPPSSSEDEDSSPPQDPENILYVLAFEC